MTPRKPTTPKRRVFLKLITRDKGVSASEARKALGWPSISIPQVAAALRLDTYKRRNGREVRHYVKAYQRQRML